MKKRRARFISTQEEAEQYELCYVMVLLECLADNVEIIRGIKKGELVKYASKETRKRTGLKKAEPAVHVI